MKNIIKSLLALFLTSHSISGLYAQQCVEAIGYGGSGYEKNEGNAVTVDSYGNRYLVGSFQGVLTFGTTTLTSSISSDIFYGGDIYIVKYDSNGTVLWAKQSHGGAQHDETYSISIDQHGAVCVCGYFSGTINFGSAMLTSAGDNDIFLTKYDNNGNVVWSKRAGGSGYDVGTRMTIDKQGNIYITGVFSDSARFDSLVVGSSGDYDIFLAKYDLNGNIKWVKSAGGAFTDVGEAVAVYSDTNIYLTGYFLGVPKFGDKTLTGTGRINMFLAKYDTNGNVAWVTSASGTDATYDDARGYNIAVDLNNNVFVTGNFIGTVRFDTALFVNQSADVFIVKYSSSGNIIWARRGDCVDPYYVISLGVTTDKDGDSYVTGMFVDTAQFGNTMLIGNGASVFLVKYSPSGSVVFAKQGSGLRNNQAQGRSVAVDSKGNIYITGTFTKSISFDTKTLTNAGDGTAIFMAKYGMGENDVSEGIHQDLSFRLQQNYPNPFSNETTILLNGSGLFEVRDLLGRVVYQTTIKNSSAQVTFNAGSLPNGLYVYSLTEGVHIQSRMMVMMK